MIDKNVIMEYSKELNILIVEDDEIAAHYIKKMCVHMYNRVDLAQNGEEALHLFKTNNDYSLILTDIDMPIMDGIEFSHRIKSINMDFPILILSGHGETQNLVRLVNIGVDGFITKPINKNILLYSMLKIVRHIDYTRSQEKLRRKLLDENHKLKIKNIELHRKNENLRLIYKNLELRFTKEVLDLTEHCFLEDKHLHLAMNDEHTKHHIHYEKSSHLIKKSAKEYLESDDFSRYASDLLDDINVLAELDDDLLTVISLAKSVDIELITKIKEILNRYTNVFKVLIEFSKISNAIDILLDGLEIVDLEYISKNSPIFLRYIEGLIDDFEKWRISIFIERDALDIHYLDDSLLNNVLAIQSFITGDNGIDGNSDDDEDDDVMMF